MTHNKIVSIFINKGAIKIFSNKNKAIFKHPEMKNCYYFINNLSIKCGKNEKDSFEIFDVFKKILLTQ